MQLAQAERIRSLPQPDNAGPAPISLDTTPRWLPIGLAGVRRAHPGTPTGKDPASRVSRNLAQKNLLRVPLVLQP